MTIVGLLLSPALHRTIACLLGSGQLHPITVAVLASPKFWYLCCYLTALHQLPSLGCRSGTVTMPNDSKPHLVCMTPSTASEAASTTLLISHGANLQTLSMSSNQDHLRSSYPLPSSASDTRHTLATPQLLVTDPEQPLLRRFYLNAAGLFLHTTNFPAPVTGFVCVNKAKNSH